MVREVDAGFEISVFVEMIGFLHRYEDVDLALGAVNIAGLRTFFAEWRAELEAGS